MYYICNLTVARHMKSYHLWLIMSITWNSTWLQVAVAPGTDPRLPFFHVGAAALFAGPVRGERGGEEEADRSHWQGPSAGRGPAGCHPERPAKGDGARLVSGECKQRDHQSYKLIHVCEDMTTKIAVFLEGLLPAFCITQHLDHFDHSTYLHWVNKIMQNNE